MRSVRLLAAVVLLLVLAAPVALPVVAAVRSPEGFAVWADAGRVGELAGKTAGLAVGACLVAVPLGTLAAVAVERVRFPGRGAVRVLVVAGLFVPLPVYAVAWQTVLGGWLPPLALEPGQVAWRPWSQGLLPAAWVHGTAGLPWVVWIVGAGLRTADRGLEEDAVLAGGPGAVVRRVLLPRAAVASAAAAGWVAVQAATEIPVTDAMMVRTFAEEVYTRFLIDRDGVAGVVAVTVPVWLAAAVVAGVLVRPAVRAFAHPPQDAGTPADLRVGRRARWAIGVGVWLAVGLFAGLPLAALVWKAGGGGTPTGWTPAGFGRQVETVLAADGRTLAGSAAAALGVGLAAGLLAWPACWLAGSSRWFARSLFGLCVVLWLTPGPVVGFGLLGVIDGLVDAEAWALGRLGLSPTFPPVQSALWDQPSPVPAGWAAVVRLFPVAVAVLWPAVRAVPRDLLDAAKLDGFGPAGEWKLVVGPQTWPAFVRAVFAVSALALGEVSAGKIVNPAGYSTYVHRLFDQMHYGAESTVAALALVQIAVTTAGVWLLMRAISADRARTG